MEKTITFNLPVGHSYELKATGTGFEVVYVKTTAAAKEWFKSLLNGSDILFDKYPNQLIFLKGDDCLFSYNYKTKRFSYSYDKIYSILKKECNLNDDEIKEVIKDTVSECFGFDDVIPAYTDGMTRYEIENYLKVK